MVILGKICAESQINIDRAWLKRRLITSCRFEFKKYWVLDGGTGTIKKIMMQKINMSWLEMQVIILYTLRKINVCFQTFLQSSSILREARHCWGDSGSCECKWGFIHSYHLDRNYLCAPKSQRNLSRARLRCVVITSHCIGTSSNAYQLPCRRWRHDATEWSISSNHGLQFIRPSNCEN